jgi:glycosyltransferase involved in cell wall biosynthesis
MRAVAEPAPPPRQPALGPSPSVLFVSLMNGAAWGGSEELWARTAAFAARRGGRVACASFRWAGKSQRLDALRAAGCRVFELPNGGHARRTVLERAEYELLTRLRRRRAFARLPVEDFPVVVLNQGGCEDAAASELSPLTRRLRRYAMTFHSYREGLVLRPSRAARLRRLVLGASANLFAARRIQSVLEDRLGLSIPNAGVLVNPVGFQIGPATAPPPAPPFRLAVLAALDVAVKGQDVLLEALARPAWSTRAWELDLWGEGRDDARLRELAARLGLAGKVRLRGHTADPRAALAGAHLVLQLSRVDAMPITVMEAMAVGRPVAVTRVGDMPDWIEDGVSGFVCERATADLVAGTLEEAWRRRGEWARMGEAAHRAFHARYPSSVEGHFLAQVGA